MWEVTVKKLSYAGSDLNAALRGAMRGGSTAEHLRLEVYIDGTTLRDPFLMEVTPTSLSAGPFTIGRKWPFENQIEFKLWGTPISSVPGVAERTPYTDRHTELGDLTLTGGQLVGSDTLGVDVSMEYEVDTGPEDVTKVVTLPDGSTGEVVHRPAAVASAMSDLKTNVVNDASFIDKEAVVAALDNLSSRVDADGIGRQPDGYPDGVVTNADQDGTDLCASTAMLVNFGFHYPRRLVEFGRSLYQSMTDDQDALHGFLLKSTGVTFGQKGLKRYYDHMKGLPNRSPELAFVDLMIMVIRGALPVIRSRVIALPEKESESDGLNVDEKLVIMEELFDVTRTRTMGHTLTTKGVAVVQAAQAAVNDGHAVILALEARILLNPQNPVTPSSPDDHAVTLLNSNVPPQGSSDPVPATIELFYQDPWNLSWNVKRIPKQHVDAHVQSVVVGER